MSKQADRRVFGRRRSQEPDQPTGKGRWWQRRRPPAQERFTEALEKVGPASVNRPVETRTSRPGRRQVDARREQREHGNRIREWLEGRLQAAEKRAAARRKAERKTRRHTSRGADRVPEHLRDQPRPTVWVSRDEPTQDPVTGRWLRGTPHRNPERGTRLAKSGRLRADEPAGPPRHATPMATGRQTRKAGPHPWRARLHAAKNGQRATPNADARRAEV